MKFSIKLPTKSSHKLRLIQSAAKTESRYRVPKVKVKFSIKFPTKFLHKLRLIKFVAKIESRYRRVKGQGRRAAMFELAQVLIVVGIFVTLLFFLWRGAVGIQKTIFEKRREVVAINQRVESERKLRQDYARAKDVLPVLETFFPAEEGIPLFLSRIDEAASIFGVVITTEIGEKTLHEGVPGLALSLKTNLELASLIQFLQSLQKLPYILQIHSVDIVTPHGVSASGDVKIHMTLFMREEMLDTSN